MREDRNRVLEMLEQGKITAAEAARLLDAVDSPVGESMSVKRSARFLRVMVDDADDHVDIRVPISLFRAGIRLAGVIPPQAQAKINEAMAEKGLGFDLSMVKPENLQELIDSLCDMKIDVNGTKGENVRIFCE